MLHETGDGRYNGGVMANRDLSTSTPANFHSERSEESRILWSKDCPVVVKGLT